MPTKETAAAPVEIVGPHEDEPPAPPDNSDEPDIHSDIHTHQDTDSPVTKRRKKNSPPINISDEHYKALVEWMHGHLELFDKSNKKFKDIQLK